MAKTKLACQGNDVVCDHEEPWYIDPKGKKECRVARRERHCRYRNKPSNRLKLNIRNTLRDSRRQLERLNKQRAEL